MHVKLGVIGSVECWDDGSFKIVIPPATELTQNTVDRMSVMAFNAVRRHLQDLACKQYGHIWLDGICARCMTVERE